VPGCKVDLVEAISRVELDDEDGAKGGVACDNLAQDAKEGSAELEGQVAGQVYCISVDF